MNNKTITLSLDAYRFEALEQALSVYGTSVEDYMQDKLIELYCEEVSFGERHKIDEIIAREKIETAKGQTFAV